MESSRGGPLTTFIMMLPLIVVPAIAMLRPINQEGSMLSDLLSATTGGGRENDAATADPDAEPDLMDDLFDEHLETGSAQLSPFAEESASTERDLFDEINKGPLSAEFPERSGRPTPSSSPERGSGSGLDSSGDPRTDELVAELKQMGASHTLWFSAGDQTVGFVAFFQAGHGTSYRFGSVADTRGEAVRNVLRQVLDWQGRQRR